MAVALRHRRWLALWTAALVAAAGAAAIGEVPNRYRATARVYVDTQTTLKPLMAGLTYQPDIDQQVQMLARTLISRPNVERLLSASGLPLTAVGGAAREEVVSRLMEQIKVAPDGAGNLYEISYRGTTPQSARRLVQATVDLFTSAGTGAKKRDSQDAGRFIDEQIRGYETQLSAAENRLKEFKVMRFGETGVPNQDYFARISTLTEAVDRLQLEVTAAEQSRNSYRRELAAEEPQLPPEMAPNSGGRALQDAQARLEAQQQRLDDLLGRFTEGHPEVIAMRRSVQLLEVDLRERQHAAERALARYGKVATSPVYQRLQILLAEAEARVAELRSQLGIKQARLDQVRSVAGRMPQVEAEFSQLNRDYDVIRKNHDLMVARRESALLGVRLDESSQLTEFRVIDPPRVSRWPAFAGQLHLAALLVLLAPAAGIAAAVGADRLRPTLADAKSLRQLTGRPVLGVVSLHTTAERQRRQRLALIAQASALGGLLVLQAAWLGWTVVAPVVAQAASSP